MSKSLQQQLLEGLQASAGVSQDFFLMVRHEHLKEVMDFIDTTPSAAYAKAKLTKVFATSNWALDPQLKETFFQLTGEVEFWMLAERRGVPLERIPEDADKNPDFRMKSADASTSPRFEVKTLSVSGGWRALDAMQEGGFEANLDLASQQAAGARVAMSEQEISPHGDVPRHRQRTVMCQNLIKKASNNIKEGQYVDGPTFLVLNLTLIDGHETGNAYLRPLASGFPGPTDVQTGVLWTIAFGDLGQVIHIAPDFEGADETEGTLGLQGILVNPDYEQVEGIILVIHSLSSPPVLYGLWRSSNHTAWPTQAPQVAAALRKLVGDNWNDERDSNGSRLTSHR